MNIGELNNTLSQSTEHLKFLIKKVDLNFGETEKIFSLSLGAEHKEKHNLAINLTNPIFLSPSTVLSKDTQKLRENVVGKIKKDAKIENHLQFLERCVMS
jgi:hypothetical protein